MLNIKAEMQTGYNGWSCWIEDDEKAERTICDAIENELPSVTSECYVDGGYLVDEPSEYEDDVTAAVAKIVGDREYALTISYDEFSS